MGKEIVQKVKWDKIPLYCGECNHVGHSSVSCYANGRKERPEKRNYHVRNYSSHQVKQSNISNNFKGGRDEGQNSLHNQGGIGNGSKAGTYIPKTDGKGEREANKHTIGHISNRAADEDGFKIQGRRKGNRQKNARQDHGHIARSNSDGDMQKHKAEERGEQNRAGILSSTIPGPSDWPQTGSRSKGQLEEALVKFSKPSYFKQLENGEFDTGVDEDDLEMEKDPGPNLCFEGNYPPPPDGSFLF